MDHRSGPPATEREQTRGSILRVALAWVKRLHLRLGIWLPVGAAGVLALALTILYTSLATAERGDEAGYVPGDQPGNPAVSPVSKIRDPAQGLRGSLRAALRRGLQVQPGGQGGR